MSAGFAQVPTQNVLADGTEFSYKVKSGNSECQALTAKNETATPITIQKILIEGEKEFFEFNDNAALPKKLAPGESVNLCYACFRPKVADKQYTVSATIFTSSGKTSHINLLAFCPALAKVDNITATAPGAIITFDPLTVKEGTLLTMTGHDDHFMRLYSFKNTSQKTFTINSASFQKTDNRFDIVSIEPGSLPMDVAPGETFSLKISYNSRERVPYNNKLLIYTDQSKEPASYEVRGFQLPLSSMSWNKRQDSTSRANK